MDKLIVILSQLGIDVTFFHQFVLFFVIFFVLKKVLFEKLQFVIEMRENKTTKLKNCAQEKYEKAGKIENEYNEKVKEFKSQSQADLLSTKESLMEKRNNKILSTEKENEMKLKEHRDVFLSSLQEEKKQIRKSIDDLSENIVEKLS